MRLLRKVFCAECLAPFMSRHPRARFCSATCRNRFNQRAWRRKQGVAVRIDALRPIPPKRYVVNSEEIGSWRHDELECGHLYRVKRSAKEHMFHFCWACLAGAPQGVLGMSA